MQNRDYDPSGGPAYISSGSGWSDRIFEISPSGCATINSCTISGPAVVAGYITVEADPFSLIMQRDVPAGYPATSFVYSCSTPQMTAGTTTDLTFSVQQYKDCSTDIAIKTTFTVTESFLTYSASTTPFDLVPSFSDIFEQATQPDCGDGTIT